MTNIVVGPIVDLNTAAIVLKTAAPDWEWLLRHIESNDGIFRFPPELTRCIERLNIGNYPMLYQNERLIGQTFARAFYSEQELIDLNKQLEAMSLTERGTVLQERIKGISDGVNEAGAYLDSHSATYLNAEYEAMSKEDQGKAIRFCQHLFMSLLANFYQVLSVMIHREKLTSLVAQAQAGDDLAFVKAIQIDNRIMTTVPYFKSRFENLHAEGNEVLRRKLSYRMHSAPYRTKVRHKTLWMGFAFLDMCGLLHTLKHREMLDVFDEAGIGGYDNRIEDVKYLSKRYVEYRGFQQNLAFLSTP